MLNISTQSYGINNPAVLGSKFTITGARSASQLGDNLSNKTSEHNAQSCFPISIVST